MELVAVSQETSRIHKTFKQLWNDKPQNQARGSAPEGTKVNRLFIKFQFVGGPSQRIQSRH